MEYASKGVAGAGLGTGIAGLSLGVLNTLGGLGSFALGGNRGYMQDAAVAAALGNAHGNCSENTAVNRYELNQVQTIANKDMEIAYWRGQDETNRKIADTYANLEGQIKSLSQEVRANKDEQVAVNMQQAVYNGTKTAALQCLQNQVAQLYGLTKLVVPNGSVCPGWGEVTVSPKTAAAS